jgi:molybdenum cofactor cytidylyltransferase
MFTTGLVLAAGKSKRLGQPKQLLAFRDRTLLDATLDMARACCFDQLIVSLGAAAGEVRSTVDLSGCVAVDNVRFTQGCSSSIVAALASVDDRADGLVLLLGDQPAVTPAAVRALRNEGASGVPLAVCRYEDGRGHPFWFARSMFSDLEKLHGDKAVWKLLESGEWPVHEVGVVGSIPLDVDTWADYGLLLESTR